MEIKITKRMFGVRDEENLSFNASNFIQNIYMIATIEGKNYVGNMQISRDACNEEIEHTVKNLLHELCYKLISENAHICLDKIEEF